MCWHKFGIYFDVEIRQVPIEEGTYVLSAEKAIEYCDENTIAVMVTLGSKVNTLEIVMLLLHIVYST